MNPLFRIDFSISDSLKIVRKSVLIYETIIMLSLFPFATPFQVFVNTEMAQAMHYVYAAIAEIVVIGIEY